MSKILMLENSQGAIFQLGDVIQSDVGEPSKIIQLGATFTKTENGRNHLTSRMSLYIKPEFVLPKAWYVISTPESHDALCKWQGFPDNPNRNILVGMAYHPKTGIYSNGWNPREFIRNRTYDFGEEITFEQFQKHVLNQ